MVDNYQVRYSVSPQDVKTHDTKALREEFLIQDLMQFDSVNLVYTQYDRYIVGDAVPTITRLKLKADGFVKS